MSPLRRAKALCRGVIAVLLLGVFSAGALLIAPVMALGRTPARCHGVVRALWRLFARACRIAGMARIETSGLAGIGGSVIVANHPSVLDVVVLVAACPRTLYVAKHALRRGSALSAVVRATSLPDDERLIESAAPYLAAGWNVLVFPEGTRTPADGALLPFHRGAAQLALRTGAPVVPVGISYSRRIFGKGQRPWDFGPDRVTCRVTAGAAVKPEPVAEGTVRPRAVALTAALRTTVESLRRATPCG